MHDSEVLLWTRVPLPFASFLKTLDVRFFFGWAGQLTIKAKEKRSQTRWLYLNSKEEGVDI
jgi:hypothetical protein